MIVFRGGGQLVDIKVDDKTVLSKKLLGDNVIKASFVLNQYIAFQLGDYVNFRGQTYSINREPEITKASAREWLYNITFYGPEYAMDSALFMLDGKTDFSLNKDVDGFLDLIITNLNRVAGGTVYTRGTAPSTGYKNLNFSGESCLNVLKKVCSEFEVEYVFTNDGKTITIVNSVSNPQSLNFQFKAGLTNISRKELGERFLVTRLYAFGSTRNIITSDYGFNRLRLDAPYYLENNVGSFGVVEGQVIFEDIYPRRNSALTSVSGTDVLVFRDTGMDFDLNDYLGSNTAKITFNTGQLAGYEFEIYSYNHTTKEFEINPITDAQELTLPNATLKPAPGDEYVLHDIKMPQSYIDNAEAELLTAATNYLNENSSPNVIYDITPDSVYFRNNVISVDVGDVVTIQDTDFGITIQTKILELTQSLANEYKYTIRVGEKVVVNYINRVLNGVLQNSSAITLERQDRTLEAIRLRNAYNDLSALPDLIFDEEGYFDNDKIKPLSIETLHLAVGAKPLQMNFVGLEIETNYQGNQNTIRISSATLFHFTIEETPRQWNISDSTPTIPDNNVRYLYARVSRTAGVTTGSWLVSSSQLSVTAQSTTYTFLVAVIHAVANNTRGISQVYGQTFINGRFITTGRIQSLNQLNYFDLDQNRFRLGDGNSSIDWNVTTPNKLTIIGGIMQSESGDSFPAVVFRGAYDNSTTYYQGDAVTYQGSTWLYINATAASGNVPAEGARWTLWAAQGADGADGPQGDPGPTGATGPEGPAGADGINGVDGLNGTDGNDGFGAIPHPIGNATIGGYSDAKFFLDQTDETTINAGEMFVRLTRLVDSQQNIKRDSLYRQVVYSPYGEGVAGIFYLVWSDTPWGTREPSAASDLIVNGNIAPFRYLNGNWQIIGNTNAFNISGFGNTDVIMCAVEAKQTTGGLTGFLSFLSGAKGLDAIQAGYFYDDFTEYGDTIDYWESWEFNSGTQAALGIYTGPSAKIGGQSIVIGDNSGNDQVWAGSRKRLAYDTEDLYQLTAKFRSVSGSGTVYFGVNGYNQAGNLVNVSGDNSWGSQHYIAASVLNPPEGVETTVVGYFQGIAATGNGGPHPNADDPATLHTDVKYISAMYIVNYSGQAGQVIIQSIEIKKINDFSPIPKGPWVSGGDYPKGSVVTYQGSSYISKQFSSTVAPTNTTYWTLIAQKGDTGAAGATGATGPSSNYVGAFVKGGRYYYTNVRRDIVFFSGQYYLYNVPTGSGGNIESTFSAGDWVSYGNVFSMVATDLLLANGAQIADWKIESGKITSQDGNSRLWGAAGKIHLKGSNTSIYSDVSRIEGEGIAITGLGIPPILDSGTNFDSSGNPISPTNPDRSVITGYSIRNGNSSVRAAGIDGRNLYDRRDSVGGYFTSIEAEKYYFKQMYFNIGRYSVSKTLFDFEHFVICVNSSNITIWLPSSPELGQQHIVKRAGGGGVTLNGNGRSFWHNANEGTTMTVPETGESWMLIYDGSYWQSLLMGNS